MLMAISSALLGSQAKADSGYSDLEALPPFTKFIPHCVSHIKNDIAEENLYTAFAHKNNLL